LERSKQTRGNAKEGAGRSLQETRSVPQRAHRRRNEPESVKRGKGPAASQTDHGSVYREGSIKGSLFLLHPQKSIHRKQGERSAPFERPRRGSRGNTDRMISEPKRRSIISPSTRERKAKNIASHHETRGNYRSSDITATNAFQKSILKAEEFFRRIFRERRLA